MCKPIKVLNNSQIAQNYIITHEIKYKKSFTFNGTEMKQQFPPIR